MLPVFKGLAAFVFYYPLFMSMIWMVGGVLFYWRRERMAEAEPTPGPDSPLVSILIPAYNEEQTIEETVLRHQNLNYPNYEIIVINDGSKDRTAQILQSLMTRNLNLRVVNLLRNGGKANALYAGLAAARGEYLVTIDSDATLDRNALYYLIQHFIAPNSGERVGAVTGNPRVRNRSTLLARIQVVEFASIIGMIKRAQRIWGKVMTVSGVIVAFRKRALMDCGLWDKDLITDDIGVTWKLQRRFWDVRYEPRAICWMLVPETFRGLWRQRVRWAQGGLEVLLRHWDVLLDWRQRRLIPIYLEQWMSVIWSFAWIIATVLMLFGVVLDERFIPGLWPGVYLSIICVIQFALAMVIESRYEREITRYYLWAAWYGIAYWYLNVAYIVAALPKALRSKRAAHAVWDSPDRGLGERRANRGAKAEAT
ncbi:MAG: poly-beta-1,6-N-acetyl-D-glucosamine synthase [Bacillota bacterium]